MYVIFAVGARFINRVITPQKFCPVPPLSISILLQPASPKPCTYSVWAWWKPVLREVSASWDKLDGKTKANWIRQQHSSWVGSD
jgi:hypothetical protein